MTSPIIPTQRDHNLKPTITVVGVGGAGGNAVNNMISSSLEGVQFVVANTDAQALDNALTDNVIQLGASITQGLGAGANPDVGAASAEEAADDIMEQISGSNMVFITAGMGGGTGTGAAPVVARMAKEQGILTVAVVTKPFHFEGTHRMKLADSGLDELQRYVDTMIVIPNQNLFRIANDKTTFADAFRMADEVLHSGVRGVTDLMVMPGLINLDFADIRTVMREMGKAMMGTGEAEGERRAIDAAEAAISNPLLDDVSMKGARGVLINITGGHDMTLFEVDEAANRIRDEVDPDANIIFGSTFHEHMDGKMRVSVVSTGIDQGKRGGYGGDSGADRHNFSVRNNASKPNMTGANLTAPAAVAAKPEPIAEVTAEPVKQAPKSRLKITPYQEKTVAPTPATITRTEPEPLMRSSQQDAPQQQAINSQINQGDVFDFSDESPEKPYEEYAQEPQQAEPVMRRSIGRHSPTRAEIATTDSESNAQPKARQSHASQSAESAHYESAPRIASQSLRNDTRQIPEFGRVAQNTAQSQAEATTQQSAYQSEPQRQQVAQAPAHDDEWEDDSEEQPGLFKRMTSKLSTRDDSTRSAQQQPARRRIEIAQSNPEVPRSSEHDLEIPAFLRRQAN